MMSNQLPTVTVDESEILLFESTEKDTLKCGKCFEIFHEINDFIIHKNQCRINPENTEDEVILILEQDDLEENDNTNKSEYVYKCFDCGKQFQKKYSYDVHYKANHTNEKPYQCLFCGKRFSQKPNARTHMETHKVI